jgi:uncharacterized protein (DUF1778 family)
MARPKKDKSDLKSIPLRIMLTADQRELIEGAATAVGLDMTAWARPLLVESARIQLAAHGEKIRGGFGKTK